MLGISLVCVGRMREKHYAAAFDEYKKRLGAYCSFELLEIPEQRLGDSPSAAEIIVALEKEGAEILKHVPGRAAVVSMCVEGRMLSSAELSQQMEDFAIAGKSRICFIVGGSFGLHDSVKERSDLRLSMSRMTFPHHLVRVMLMEQVYRAFNISAGTKYHK